MEKEEVEEEWGVERGCTWWKRREICIEDKREKASGERERERGDEYKRKRRKWLVKEERRT